MQQDDLQILMKSHGGITNEELIEVVEEKTLNMTVRIKIKTKIWKTPVRFFFYVNSSFSLFLNLNF